MAKSMRRIRQNPSLALASSRALAIALVLSTLGLPVGARALTPASVPATSAVPITTPATAAPTTTTPATAAPAASAPATATATVPIPPSAAGAAAAAGSLQAQRTAPATTKLSTGAIVAAALAGLLIVVCLGWGIARWWAYEPRWTLSLRHCLAEAGWRLSASWDEFSDWARLGR
jgi:hypothetical protein